LPAFFRNSVEEFLSSDPASIVGSLSASLVRRLFGDYRHQVVAWTKQLEILKTALETACHGNRSVLHWAVLVEYPLLRLQRRLDVVLIAGQRIVVIEFKINARTYEPADERQVEDYALDLRDFHEASHRLTIVPILCASEASAGHVSFDAAAIGVTAVRRCNRVTLGNLLLEVAKSYSGPQINAELWDTSPYRPVPTIIEAAELLYAGHQVTEIAQASTTLADLFTPLCAANPFSAVRASLRW
jgi:hypothetical protein